METLVHIQQLLGDGGGKMVAVQMSASLTPPHLHFMARDHSLLFPSETWS